MAKNSLIRSTVDGDVLTLTVGNEASGPIGEIVINRDSLTDEIIAAALFHGLTQKVSDAAAISRDELSGNAKDDAKLKFSEMLKVAERLTGPDGEWSARKGDGSGPVSGLIFRAFEEWATDMAAKRKKPVPSTDALRAVYDAKTRAEQLALRNVPEIAAIIDRIKAEKGSKGSTVDTGSLLGELGL
jgi:hypothetical protein